MRIRVPDYYEKFRCLAGDCPHTCCEKWEVVIDQETAMSYFELPGQLGDRLRAVMQADAEGSSAFPCPAAGAPFWTGRTSVRSTGSWGRRPPLSPAAATPALLRTTAPSGR